MRFGQPPDDPELAQLWLAYTTAREREAVLKQECTKARNAVRALRPGAGADQIAQVAGHYHELQEAREQAHVIRVEAA